MSVDHLKGKRSGRPPGKRSRPAWERAMRWVERHVRDEAATPPSPLAGAIMEKARQELGWFLLMLQELEQRSVPPPKPAGEPLGVTAYRHAERVKRLITTTALAEVKVNLDQNVLRPKLPKDYRWMDACTRDDQVVLIVYSASFPVVEPGQPIPELRLDGLGG